MDSLKKTATTGIRWTGFSATVTALMQIVQFLALAKLLGPEEFGLMAMAMVVTSFMQTIADMGISSAVIYRQDATVHQLSSLYMLSIVLGLLGFLAVMVSAPFCASFFNTPELKGILLWCAPIFIIAPLGQQFAALLQKNLHFRELSTIDILSQACGVAIAILLAWLDAGVMALVWSLLAATLLRTLLFIHTGLPIWRPVLHFRTDDLRDFLSFGFFQTASNILNFFSSRFDQLLLGRFLGVVPLGHYNFAYNLVMQPIARINPIVTRVAFPAFAKVQNENEKLRHGYLLVSRALLTVNAPLLIGVAVLMHETIGVIFQPKWTQSVPVVEILAIVALFRSSWNPLGSLLLAQGRAKREFFWNILVMSCNISAICIGAYLGQLRGVALGLLLVQLLLFIPGYMYLIKRTIGPCLRSYLRNLAAPLFPALLMGSVISIMPNNLEGVAPLCLLLLKILTGMVIYLGILVIFQRQFLVNTLFKQGK